MKTRIRDKRHQRKLSRSWPRKMPWALNGGKTGPKACQGDAQRRDLVFVQGRPMGRLLAGPSGEGLRGCRLVRTAQTATYEGVIPEGARRWACTHHVRRVEKQDASALRLSHVWGFSSRARVDMTLGGIHDSAEGVVMFANASTPVKHMGLRVRSLAPRV